MQLSILPNSKRTSSYSCFPHCRLHGVRIVDRLPLRCPFRAPLANRAVEAIKDAAWQELASNRIDLDLTGGLIFLDRAEACERCIFENIAHPAIKRLRAQSGATQ